MVRAWVFNEKAEGDQRSHHYPVPFEPVSLSRLAQLGVLYFTMNPSDVAANPDGGEIGELRKQRGYKNYDIITISKDKLPNYEEKLSIFFKEHLHEDEEIRFVLDGQGYFDVRDDTTAEWIRIETVKGDMIVLPEGMYHRFTLDLTNYIQAMRLFKEAPKWEAINRGLLAETTTSRHRYTDFIQSSLHKPIVPPFTVARHPSNGSTALTLENHAAALANYPHARRHQGVIYVSGLSSRRADNTHRGATKQEDGTFVLDIAEQTRGVLENMRTVLATAGATLDDVLDVSVYLVNMKDYNDFNQVYNTYFSNPATAPTRTTVAVHQLPHPNLLIEIKALAADPQVRAATAPSSSASSSASPASQSSA